MTQQIPLPEESSALDPALDAARGDHTHEVAPDLAIVASASSTSWSSGRPARATAAESWSMPD